MGREFNAIASVAFAGLEVRVARLEHAGLLGGRRAREVAMEFHALCEGLAAVELRGLMAHGQEDRIWRDALSALVSGFALPARQSPPRVTGSR